jgi:ribosomal 50S subunit-recycling heat shock protein
VRAVRLDKYLKVSRVIKRRTLAQELCLGGHVKKNGRTAKPSTGVEVGDLIEVTLGQRCLSFRILKVADAADKKTASEMYETLAGSDGTTQGSVRSAR